MKKVGIIGEKVGMSSYFDNVRGVRIPCTVIWSEGCKIAQIKTLANEGYDSVQLSYGIKKEKNISKSVLGHIKKANVSSSLLLREIRDFDLNKIQVLEQKITNSNANSSTDGIGKANDDIKSDTQGDNLDSQDTNNNDNLDGQDIENNNSQTQNEMIKPNKSESKNNSNDTEFNSNDTEFSIFLGKEIKISDLFSEGDIVNVVGKSKGKGFQGVVKRHRFSGVGGQTHGQHNRLRAPGSVGASSFPSRVFKGTRMAGKTGNSRVTVKNLQVLKIINNENLIVIKGCVPGDTGSIVFLEK